ncbi:hypothetical protein DNTS_017582, partial [Danionella cerebrum]
FNKDSFLFNLKEFPDEAGEESVLSSGEHKGFSGDQESLLLFLLPLLLKQNPSRSPDHLGSRVQRMQWQPVQNVQTLQSRMMELAEEFPDEAGEGSVLSSGEHKGFSGDQESLLLFLLPLLLKQNLSRSQDHLGSRGQRIQGQPVLNGLLQSQMTTEFPDEAGDKSLHSSGEKLEYFGDQENRKLSRSQGHLDSKVQRAQLQPRQSLIMSLAEVAVKCVSNPPADSYIFVPDHPKPLYGEMALLVMLRRPPVCPYVIKMLDWFDMGGSLSIVMEYPESCMSLKEFIRRKIGIPISNGYIIMRQLIKAVQFCLHRRVFHNDINLQNILVYVKPVPKIKLIGFNSARLLDEDGYDASTYNGDPRYMPPEVFAMRKYHAVPTSVWFMGIIFYAILKGQLPFHSIQEIFFGPIQYLPLMSSRSLGSRTSNEFLCPGGTDGTRKKQAGDSVTPVPNHHHHDAAMTEIPREHEREKNMATPDLWNATATEGGSSGTEFPDEAGEESVLSSGEHESFSGDQESLHLFLPPLLLKQNLSRSQDHLGSRVLRMQWQPLQNIQTLQSRMMELAEEFPDEAGEGSVGSSEEQGSFSGDQESLLLFLPPLLLKQNLSRSQDHLGSRGQRMQWQPVQNGLLQYRMTTEFPDEAGDKSLHSSGEKLEYFGDQENRKLSRSQGHLDSKVQRAQLQPRQSLIMSLAEVAVKCVSNPPADSYIFVPDHPKPLYGEMALLVMLRRPPVCPYVIKMLDWFDMGGSLSIVMEYPESCMSLKEFIRRKIGIPISNGYIIMRQLIKAVQFCLHRRVFHNDINLQNILVYVKPVPKIKLIGFNSARLLDEDGYDASTYNGDPRYMPPEVFAMRKYHAVPTSVWFMGIIFYAILKGQLPFHSIQEIFFGPIQYLPLMSSRCEYLLRTCLSRRADMRPTLEELLEH